ncbi:MAG: choice-of-anchor J domain-containing protein [Bacteroidetes bacterium]|nr:choice-of-anchor J domain-containing protein [Bacteroidota bacterium]
MIRVFGVVIMVSMFFGTPGEVMAQRTCGTYLLEQIKIGDSEYRKQEKLFENWLSKRIVERNQQLRSLRIRQDLVQLPVVVHVIHNGESIGTGTNIPNGQIFSQIDILNADYRRLNEDTTDTPVEFLDVATDTKIEFILAKQDPEGLPTDGIVRVKGNQSKYSITQDEILKANSLWPPESYINIWVADLDNDLLGYSQFPVSNLSGLTVDRTNNRLTDGVVVDYKYFGIGFNTDAFSVGRTATHEVGHFLGLRHIWGDGGCSFDDSCADTPFMSDNSTGCPVGQESCGSVDMYQNYMDFTDDRCMNLFTICQSGRMRAILEESPRRLSLLESQGGVEPVVVSDDMGIRKIISPEASNCQNLVAPQIEVRNYGNNVVNSFRVSLMIDNVSVETKQSNISLDPLELVVVTFNPVSFNPGEKKSLSFNIEQTNNTTDKKTSNNLKQIDVQTPFQLELPLFVDFENGIDSWTTKNFDGSSSNWQIANAPRTGSDNQALKLAIFNAPIDDFGNLEMLLSPVLNLEKVELVELHFRYAYAPVNGNIIDGLVVAVLTDCGNTVPPNKEFIFEKYGSALATTTEKSGAFVPVGPSEWYDVTLTLNQYQEMGGLQVAIIAQNGAGNNLYIDDVELLIDSQFALDVRVTEVNELPLISCQSFQTPIIEVRNFGTETINSMDYTYSDGINNYSGRQENLNMVTGGAQDIAIGLPDLFQGEFNFEFTITSINDVPDEDESDNTINQIFRITEAIETLPLRERFEDRSLTESGWFPFSRSGNHEWSVTTQSNINGSSQVLTFNAFSLTTIGTQNWYTSPRLDLSQLTEASIKFDVSYAYTQGYEDQLQIFVSTDCGRNFNNIIYDKRGENLSIKASETEWFPASSEDWDTEIIDLTQFVGFDDVLLAFVFTNANGNNLYIDNIDFFITATPEFIDLADDPFRVYPIPTGENFYVAFNLLLKETVSVRLIDMMGHRIFESELNGALNQTFSFDTNNLRNGIYFVQVIGDSFKGVERIVVFK